MLCTFGSFLPPFFLPTGFPQHSSLLPEEETVSGRAPAQEMVTLQSTGEVGSHAESGHEFSSGNLAGIRVCMWGIAHWLKSFCDCVFLFVCENCESDVFPVVSLCTLELVGLCGNIFQKILSLALCSFFCSLSVSV